MVTTVYVRSQQILNGRSAGAFVRLGGPSKRFFDGIGSIPKYKRDMSTEYGIEEGNGSEAILRRSSPGMRWPDGMSVVVVISILPPP